MDTREDKFTYEVKRIEGQEEWGKARFEGIGASEAAQGCGKSPFGSVNDLWQLKTGLSKPLEQNEDMRRGHELEPVVRNRFMHDYGTFFELDYNPYYMYYRSDYGMIFATLDGIVKARVDFMLSLPGCAPLMFHAGEKAILEIKNPKPRLSFSYNDWDVLPRHYRYQNACQMFCTGIEKHIEIVNLTGEYAHPDEQGMDLRYFVSQYGDYLTEIEEIRRTIPQVWKDIKSRQPVPTAMEGAGNEVIVLKSEVTPGAIIENFDEVKLSIERYASQFKGLKFTDGQYAEAKDFRKELNAQTKLIDDTRKSVKKRWLEPLDAFEAKCKELTKIIDEVNSPIAAQIADFEAREKEAKREECLKALDEILSSLKEDYRDIIAKSGGIAFDERWLNRTAKMSSVRKEMQSIVDAQKSNIDLFYSAVMANVTELDADAVMHAFLKSGRDVNAALRTKAEIEQTRAERERKEAEKKAEEAVRKAQSDALRQQAPEAPAPVQEPRQEMSAPSVGGQRTWTIVMEVTATDKAMFAELSNYMKNAGFTFRRIS